MAGGELPDFVPPMLARSGGPFDSDEHLFEVKWDGTRVLAYADGGGAYRLLNRRRRAVADRYPELRFLTGLEPGAVLDGEVCVLADGKADFHGMLTREQARGERRFRELARELPATYVVFDLVWRRFESRCERTLLERREELAELVAAQDEPRLVLSDGVVGAGLELFEQVDRLGIEGVVAKRLASRYHPGARTDEWTKIKRRRHVHCVVLGFQAEGSDLRSLIVGTDDEGRLRCVGRVGSGLTDALRAELLPLLRARVADAPVVDCGENVGTWVEPSVFCTVSYLERTRTGMLRAPVFVALVAP